MSAALASATAIAPMQGADREAPTICAEWSPSPVGVTAAHWADLTRAWPEELQGLCTAGHCDAWAAAAVDFLTARGVPCGFVLGERRSWDRDDGTVMECNPLSHVAVAAWDGSWDVGGGDAQARWQAKWRSDDEMVHHFRWTARTLRQVAALRRLRDRRPIDADVRRRCRNELERRWALLGAPTDPTP